MGARSWSRCPTAAYDLVRDTNRGPPISRSSASSRAVAGLEDLFREGAPTDDAAAAGRDGAATEERAA